MFSSFSPIMPSASRLIAFLYGIVILGSALRIDITPDVYTEDNAGPVNISCQLDSSDAANADIILLQILNDAGQPVVFLRKGEILSFGNEYSNSSKFQADGIINLLDSYLRLSIFDPKRTDAGLFTCKMFFTDSAGSLEEQRASGNLVLEKLDVNEVVRQLMEGMSTLKKELEVQNTKVLDMAVTINELKVSNKKLLSATNSIQDKMTYVCAFSAGFQSKLLINKNTGIIFTDVHTNLGGAYDKITGVFTAPRNGLYALNLVMTAGMNTTYCCSGHVDLSVNGAEIGWLRVNVGKKLTDEKRLPQSSVSQVVTLNRGDKVKARTWSMKMFWRGGHYSHFSGFLVKEF